MSLRVESSGIGQRQELAGVLARDNEKPKSVLQSIFTDLVNEMKRSRVTVTEEQSVKVWLFISNEKLNVLQEEISKIYESILKGFKEEDVAAMLQERKEKGAIHTQKYLIPLQDAIKRNQIHILNCLSIKMLSMVNQLSLDIFKKFKEEGVEFPTKKRSIS